MSNAALKSSGWGLRAAGVVAVIVALNVIPHYWQKPAPHPAAAVPTIRPVEEEKRIQLTDEQSAEVLPPRFEGRQLPRIRSILNIKKPMRYGEFAWNDDGVPAGEIWIRVDLSRQLMSVFRGGQEIGTAVVMFGADEKPTPIGTFPVKWKKAYHQSSIYDAEMPYTLRLTDDGVSVHGADVRARAATHGCVSIPTDFAKLLFDQVKIGDPVTILPEKRGDSIA